MTTRDDAPADAPSAATLRRVLAVLRWMFTPLALLALAWAGWHARALFTLVSGQADRALMLAAVALWLSLHLVTPLFTWIVLQGLGAGVPYRTLLRIHVARLPARYLPGGIWHTVSRAMDLHRLGVTRRHLTVMVVLEHAVPAGAALMLGGMALSLTGAATWLAPAAVVAGAAGLAATLPALRHPALRLACKFEWRRYLGLVATICGFWLVAATAFYCYWSAFPAVVRGAAPALQLYGAYLLAWVAGFVSVFAPQGIGVFESVAGLFLRGALTLGGTAVLVAGFRLVVLGADMIAFGACCAVRMLHRKRASDAH